MCVKRDGMGNLFGGLFTLLMLIVMFSVAHGRFQELIYISLGFLAITLAFFILRAFYNLYFECKGNPIVDHWNSSCHRSSRYRNHYYNNNANRNRRNHQRIHVCAPPRMGGARLNIIYTIGDVNDQIPFTSQSLDSMAINIGNNCDYETQISRPRPQSRSLTRTRSPSRRYRFRPIITITPNHESNQGFQQLISASYSFPTMPPILPPESHIDFTDLPPQYDQLDIIRPPSYEEAVQKG